MRGNQPRTGGNGAGCPPPPSRRCHRGTGIPRGRGRGWGRALKAPLGRDGPAGGPTSGGSGAGPGPATSTHPGAPGEPHGSRRRDPDWIHPEPAAPGEPEPAAPGAPSRGSSRSIDKSQIHWSRRIQSAPSRCSRLHPGAPGPIPAPSRCSRRAEPPRCHPSTMHPLVLCALGVIAVAQLGSSFKLEVEPAQPVVEHGGSVRLRLKSTCDDPKGYGNVETSILKQLLPAAPGERVVELLNVTQWNSSILCYYSCGGQREVLPIKLIVYRPLEPPVLEPVPALAVGQLHELACVVAEAAPLRKVKVRLRRGGALLHTWSFQGQSRDEPVTVRVTHGVRAERGDHGLNLTCEAELDLEPQGPRFSAESAPQELTVYDFPEDPELEPHLYLEPGETLTTSCRVASAFPAPRFELALANRSLPVSISGDGLRATAELSHEEPGDLALVCAVTVGPMQRRKEAAVHVFRFPSPQLEVPARSVVAGTEVGGSCALPSGHSRELRLRIRANGRVLAGWAPSPLPFSVPVLEGDDGMELSCDAQFPGSGKAPKSSGSVRLNVSAAPRMDDRSCPPQQNWTEGQDEALQCWAWGKPRPLLECSRAGDPFPVGEPQRATRAHAGTYLCSASNRLGTAVRSVTVTVSYHDPDLVLLVLVPVLAVTALLTAGLGYGVYYRKKKIRQYRLRQRQQRGARMERMEPARPPPGCSEEAAAAALNGSAREARP